MTIPNYQDFMLPVLKAAAKGNVYITDVVKEIADEMHISEEDRELTISNGTSLLYSRITWAKTYLMQAGLLESTGRGQFTISPEGLALLAKKPNKIDNKTLEKYPSFNAFKKRSKKSPNKNEKISVTDDLDELSPEEAIFESVENQNSSLLGELHRRILKTNPTFFEKFVIKLLVAMGYGHHNDISWKHVGKPGDGGVDGLINQDVLGVDKIYIQAKRYSSSVPAKDARDFIGSMDTYRASKGVFVTTSSFTDSAKNTFQKSTKNIVLIDGEYLVQLMMKYNVGCKIKETIHIQKIDEDFFEEM